MLPAIEAPPGHVLLEADYSQMELRVLARFSQDAALLHTFQHDIDLHARTAARVLDIAETDVTDQQRSLGKTLNFGIVYGQTAYGLADELGVTMQRAEQLLAAHAAAYPGVIAWIAAGSSPDMVQVSPFEETSTCSLVSRFARSIHVQSRSSGFLQSPSES